MAAEGHILSSETINPNLYDKNNFDNMEYFNDIFDILNDADNDQGGEQDIKDVEELANIIEEYNQDFDFDYINTNVDEEEMKMVLIKDDSRVEHDSNDKTVEEQILSQKLSQLSTKDEYNDDDDKEEYSASCNKKRQLSTPSTPDVVLKKIRPVDNNEIPGYLQSTNKIFDQTLADYITNNSVATITIEDLRQLAILKHKIADTNLRQKLWTIYLKSGTGQWAPQESAKTSVDRRIWPAQVKKMISLSDTIDISEEKDEKGEIYETLVHKYLEELNHIIEQYQSVYDKKKNDLMNYTDGIEKIIGTFVQQHGIRPLEMKFNYKVAILEFDYNAEILEREYLRLKPTEYQIQQAKHLYDLRFKYLQSTEELIELKQRILCNKPIKSMDPPAWLMVTSTITTDPMVNETVRQQQQQQQKDQQQKEIQEKRTDSMIASIIQTEDTIHEYKQLFDKEICQLSVNDNNKDEGLTGNLVDLIYRRFKIMNKKLRYIYNFRINYFLRRRDVDLEDKINQPTMSFSPTMIIDTSSHHFTHEQLKLLNRGPTYVPPCQMYVSSSYVSMNDMLQKQYKVLQHYLSILFTKYNINTARSMFINKEIKDVFIKCFSISLPLSIYQRALYEKQLVESIQVHLKINHLILRRTADQRNVFYLGNMKDFNEKENEFMTKTDAFEVCEIIDETNLQQTHAYLTKIIQSMNSELDTILFNNKKTHKDLLEKLHIINTAKVQLPYLYFLPDMSKKNTLSVAPVIVSQCSVTSRLAQFLDGLLRPIIQRHAQSTAFVNGTDFIRKINQYTEEQQRLRPTTIFTVIKISNFNTIVSHGTMLITLKDYLNDNLVYTTIENISISKVIQLTALFLHNNRFYYNNKIYRFTKGGPNSLLLTETLCNIYVFQWQKLLLKELSLENELYGRCKNQIFFTWNKKAKDLVDIVKNIKEKNTDFHFETNIGFTAQFLNASIKNQNGTLYSCVYHDRNSQKYTLPYVIGDAKVAHSHWLRSALIRAVRFCTSVYDFNQERIYLEITCLANGYSLEFVERRINHFFTHFDATSLRSVLDHQVYNKLRHRLFNFISEQQQFFNRNQELKKNNQRIQLTYLYQFGPKRQFDKKLQEILSENLHTTAQSSRQNKIKIILTTKQEHSLNALLSQQKPSHNLLNQEKTIF